MRVPCEDQPEYLRNGKAYNTIYIILWKALIIHEENTKEMMSVKEFVYLIQNHADLRKL
jgi:hypothetical protein